MPITVSIVEDNEQLRGTLARVISRAEGFRDVRESEKWGSHVNPGQSAPKRNPNGCQLHQ